MKILFCLTFLFAIASSSMLDLSDLSKIMDPKDTVKDASNELSIFAESVFNHFGLDKPTQILNCFEECNEKLLFKDFRAIRNLLEDSRDRKSFAVHADYLLLELINKALGSTFGCIMMTQDFTNLLDALEIDERDPEFFGMVIYLYYQAFYPRLADDIQPLVQAFKAKDFSQAGEIFGGLIENMVNEIRTDKFPYLAYSAFANGVATELKIEYLNDSIKCHNNDTAFTVLRFVYKLARRVEQGGWREAPLSTLNFWNDEGKELLSSIPQEVIDCNMQSRDFQILSDRIGIRLDSPAFVEALKRFITKKSLSYFSMMKSVRSSMDDHNFVHAGWAWGHLFDSLSKSLPNGAKPEEVEA